MGTDFRELANYHYQRYEQHKAKEAEYRANGPSSKELAETEERLAASAYSAYRAARDCISGDVLFVMDRTYKLSLRCLLVSYSPRLNAKTVAVFQPVAMVLHMFIETTRNSMIAGIVESRTQEGALILCSLKKPHFREEMIMKNSANTPTGKQPASGGKSTSATQKVVDETAQKVVNVHDGKKTGPYTRFVRSASLNGAIFDKKGKLSRISLYFT